MIAVALTLLPILLLTTWPLRAYVGHAHWSEVEWVPFSQKVAPLDFLLNALLFLPFGVAVAWVPAMGRLAPILAGLAVSVLVEAYQVHTHTAFATTADVMANTCGAWLGGWLADRKGPPYTRSGTRGGQA